MRIGKVYKITCLVTNKVYVGSTINSLENRWKSYKRLRCRRQYRLYESLLDHGVDNHSFEKIWEGSIDEMLKQECILGNTYNVLNPSFGLNLRLPYYNSVYQHVSEETRAKLVKAATGKKMPLITSLAIRTEEAKRKIAEQNYVPIIQLSLEGRVIKEWKSATHVFNETGIKTSNIQLVCAGKRRQAGGFKWMYKYNQNKE